jgi:large conductance mechanosensitive channel
MFKEFKEFAMKGNVVDLAVGVIIGASFGAIVKSLVDDIIMPPIGFILGNVDFTNLFIVLKEGSVPAPYATLADATKAGAVLIKYGSFSNTVVSFLIVTFSVFILIKQLSRFKNKEISVAVAPPSEEVKLLSEIRDLLKNK